MTPSKARFASLVLLTSLTSLIMAGCPLAPPPADEQGDGDEAGEADETAGADMLVDACAGEDLTSEGDICGSSNTFAWDGERCVEVCDGLVGHTLFDGAHDCFEAHAQCFDAEQCELGPVGITDVSGTLMQPHPGLHAGVFEGNRMYLGPDAFDVGAALTSEFGSGHGTVYQSVLGISSDTDWQVGVQEVYITEIGAWSGVSGTVTIESVTTEGNPNEWRLRGQIDVDDSGQTLHGSFEVAGCVS